MRGQIDKVGYMERGMCVSDCLDSQLLGSYYSMFHLFASLCSLLQLPRLEKHFGVSFVLIHSMIGELLPEVDSQVGHGFRLCS